jgi:AmiR/NasT family two-component response regulator
VDARAVEAASTGQLRVLVADSRQASLDRVVSILTRLGHHVVGRAATLSEVAQVAERELPDVAIVVVGEDTQNALAEISRIVHEAVCPAIAFLDAQDPGFIRAAAKRGVFAYVVSSDLNDGEVEGAIEVVLHRFAEYHDLEGAFGRRAVIERAKGVLMERHKIDEEAAFRMLRDQSRNASRKLVDVAQALLDSHTLLPRGTPGDAG